MVATPARLTPKLPRPKSRWAYALWTVLAVDFLSNAHTSPDPATFDFWISRLMAALFGLFWFRNTLARLREFGWNRAWILAFLLPWIGLIWVYWWRPGPIGVLALASWFVAQSFLILKNGSPNPRVEPAEGKA